MVRRITRLLIGIALALWLSEPSMPQDRPAPASVSDIQSALAPLPQSLNQLKSLRDELKKLDLSQIATEYRGDGPLPLITVTGESFMFCSFLDLQLIGDAEGQIDSIRSQPESFNGVAGFEFLQTLNAILGNVEATLASLKYERALKENAKDDSALRQIDHLTDKLLEAEQGFFVARAGVDMWYQLYLASVDGVKTRGNKKGAEEVRALIKQLNKATKNLKTGSALTNQGPS